MDRTQQHSRRYGSDGAYLGNKTKSKTSTEKQASKDTTTISTKKPTTKKQED